MTRPVAALLLSGVLLGPIAPGQAQAPGCEEQRMKWELVAGQVMQSRHRTELEAAEAVVRLLRRIADLERRLAEREREPAPGRP